MPKELTHWQVARKAYQGLIPTSIKGIIASSPELYYLGTVAHDVPFYDLSQPAEARIEWIGNHLHGVNGENTLVPLLNLVSQVLQKPVKDYLLSFLLGMFTHYVTDSTFHPVVYYLSGNYFDEDPDKRGKAIFRHRLLETGIDLWLETLEPLDYPKSLASLRSKAGTRGNEALNMLIELYGMNGNNRNEEIKAHFKHAWRNHRLLQSVFNWPIPWHALRVYRLLGHPGAEKVEALFYPQPFNLSFFQNSFQWCHPVTGEKHQSTLEELFLETSEKVKVLFRELGSESFLNWPEIIQTWKPLSLDSGLPYVPVKEMKYFMEEPIEKALQGKNYKIIL